MRKLISMAVIGGLLASSPVALANTKNDKNQSNERFFKCHVLEDTLWRAILTGKWPFHCD